MGYVFVCATAIIAVISFLIEKYREKGLSCAVNPQYDFFVDATGATVSGYVSKMSEQCKLNSRLLSGDGKMHYVEIVALGSNAIKDKKISIIENIGERFS